MSDELLDAVVIGAGPAGLTAAIYLGRYLRNFVVLDGGDPRAGWIPISNNHPGFPEGIPGVELLARLREQASRYDARIVEAEATRLEQTSDGFIVCTEDGVARRFDVIYSALGTTPRGALAEELGAKVDEVGSLLVNSHQMTTIEGLYAAGDLVRGLNQITVAEAEAAIAATGIHNRLRAEGL